MAPVVAREPGWDVRVGKRGAPDVHAVACCAGNNELRRGLVTVRHEGGGDGGDARGGIREGGEEGPRGVLSRALSREVDLPQAHGAIAAASQEQRVVLQAGVLWKPPHAVDAVGVAGDGAQHAVVLCLALAHNEYGV